jgi:hypothetical protein
MKAMNHERPSAAAQQPRKKKQFHHEGHEDHEVYDYKYPKPSCPS